MATISRIQIEKKKKIRFKKEYIQLLQDEKTSSIEQSHSTKITELKEHIQKFGKRV